jgi:uncharacterized membrane protein (DUF485 family)
MDALERQINADPAFHSLRKRRSKFSWILTIVMLGNYYAYILVIAFKPGWLAIPLHADTVITWGIPVSLGMILLSLMLTGIYVVRSNREFDPAIKTIIEAAEQATSSDSQT